MTDIAKAVFESVGSRCQVSWLPDPSTIRRQASHHGPAVKYQKAKVITSLLPMELLNINTNIAGDGVP